MLVITNVREGMEAYKEEMFGPVATLIRVRVRASFATYTYVF